MVSIHSTLNLLPKSSEKVGFFQGSFLHVNSEIPDITKGPHGLFLDYGSFAACFCNECDGSKIELYTCKGDCEIKCPPHTRKCSKCASNNYLNRHKINRKYYANRKSRLNSITSKESLINNSDSVADIIEIWNNSWSEIFEQLP
ncbi:4128_t:CDS:1, partial [Scutellospora calospora]